jgi:integrase
MRRCVPQCLNVSKQNGRQSALTLDLRAIDNQNNTAQKGKVGRGKITTHLPLTRAGGVGKNSANYWLPRLRKPVNRLGVESPHYLMQLCFKGRRLAFGLGTGNRDAAAKIAAGIYTDILTLSVEGALAKHRPKAASKAGIATVGEWVEAARAVSDVNPSTFTSYAQCLRHIAGGLLAVKRTKKRFGPKKGGAAAYRAGIDAASLDIFKPAALQQWRLAYIKKAKNPAEERSRMTSCNSNIRQARSLFSGKIVRFLPDLRLPDPPPFAGVQFYPRQSAKYFSRIDAKELLQKAGAELAESDPPAFLAMLLALSAGLRRGEIDGLVWRQVDFDRQLVRIEPTDKAGLKTADSRDEVPIDEHVAALLRGHFAKVKRPEAFVIEAEGGVLDKTAGWRHYRADAVFVRLTDWLRAQGVTARKPLHELRKELGSLVTAEHGIYAASRVLRHSNVATTAAHYADLKTRPVVNVGAWLAEGDGIVKLPRDETPSAPAGKSRKPKKRRGERGKVPGKRLARS